jgi:hypothetical protein
VWAQEGPDLALFCLTGNIAPTAPPGQWNLDSVVPVPMMSHNGRVAFRTGFAVGNGNYQALFQGVPSGNFMCARNEINSANNGFVGFGEPQFNDEWNFGVLAPNRNNDGTRNGIWLGPCGGLNPVIVQGATVPAYVGLPEFTTFISPTLFGINNSASCTFVCSLNGTGVTASNDTTLWIKTNSGFRLIAREGEQVPGLPAGCFYSDFGGSFVGPLLSESGHVAWATNIFGPGTNSSTNRVIMRYSPDGAIVAVARLGDQVPGYPSGITYLAFGGSASMALNGTGHLAFPVSIFAPPAGRGGSAILVAGPVGDYQIVAESNQVYTVRPGLEVRLTSVIPVPLLTGGYDGRPRNWNDSLQYAFRAGYSLASNSQVGGVGVFVASLPVGASCDPDVSQDGNADQGDIDYLVNVVAGGPNPSGIDPDFNRDGNVDQGDVDALIDVVAGGACP